MDSVDSPHPVALTARWLTQARVTDAERDADEAQALARVRRHRAQGLALLLDVDTFGDQGEGGMSPELEVAVRILTEQRWRVLVVPRGVSVPEAWAGLTERVAA